MFARFFEIKAKPGKKQEFFKTLKDEILPILNKYEIIDLIPLEPETEAAKVIVISFWQSKAAIEIYENEAYPTIWALLAPFVVERSDAKLCKVETSIREQVLAVTA
jgi:quinol monooxygenase YgiN